MTGLFSTWQFWGTIAAVFAALTAILAKVGVDGVDADVATFLRTVVVLFALAAILAVRGQFAGLGTLSPRSAVFLALSGLATGASWVCYFRALKLGDASQVAPVDKLSVVLVALFGVTFLGEHLSAAGWAGVALIASGAVLMLVG